MSTQKKKLGIVGVILGLVVLLPRPAQAFSFPGPLNNILNSVTNVLGLGIGLKMNKYLSLGLGKLDKLLGIDPGTVSGSLGIIDPLQAAQAIDDKNLSQIQSDLAITPTAQGNIDKGRFNVGLAAAIGSSIFSADTQSALKDSTDAIQQTTQQSAQLAQDAQSQNVTQNIAKIQTQQNAQITSVLNTINQKADLQLQQQAATSLSSSVSAQHANNEEQQAAQDAANDATYTTQQIGVSLGVTEGIGK